MSMNKGNSCNYTGGGAVLIYPRLTIFTRSGYPPCHQQRINHGTAIQHSLSTFVVGLGREQGDEVPSQFIISPDHTLVFQYHASILGGHNLTQHGLQDCLSGGIGTS